MKPHQHYSGNAFSSGPRWIARICGTTLIATVLAFCGCVSRPALDQQTFAFSAPSSPATNLVAHGPVLEIRALQILPPFDGRSLIYRTGDFSYQRDPYAGFLGLPAEGLVVPVIEMLRRDGRFGEVVQPGSAVQPDILAEITVTQFYGDIRKPRSSYAVLAMQITFMGATNGLPEKVILQQNYSRRIPISSTSPAALMKGWNQALADILTEATSDFQNRETEVQGYETNAGSLTKKSSETP